MNLFYENKSKFIMIIGIVIIAFVASFYFRSLVNTKAPSVSPGESYYPPATEVSSEISIPINKTIPTKLAGDLMYGYCYKNFAVQIDSVSYSNDSNQISVPVVLINNDRATSCYFGKELIRIFDQNKVGHIDSGAKSQEIAPLDSQKRTLVFDVPTKTKEATLMVGVVDNPDAVYKIDFVNKSFSGVNIPSSERKFLRLHVTLSASDVCFGKDIKVQWESNGLYSIKFYLRRFDWPRENVGNMFYLGEFPATNNENGISGKGEFTWNAQQAIPYIKDGAQYSILGWATSLTGDHEIFVETDEKFTLNSCQG